MMFNSFSYFLYNNDINLYLNCYSTFMMTNQNLKDNVLNHRMNFLINYYIQENKSIQNRNKLLEYYLRSYKDTYLVDKKKDIVSLKTMDDQPEKRDDDVEDHYKYMFINPPPKEPIDYDELDKQYELKLQMEEEEKKKENDYCEYSDDEYDDYYDYNSYDNDDYNDCEYENEYDCDF